MWKMSNGRLKYKNGQWQGIDDEIPEVAMAEVKGLHEEKREMEDKQSEKLSERLIVLYTPSELQCIRTAAFNDRRSMSNLVRYLSLKDIDGLPIGADVPVIEEPTEIDDDTEELSGLAPTTVWMLLKKLGLCSNPMQARRKIESGIIAVYLGDDICESDTMLPLNAEVRIITEDTRRYIRLT